MSRGVRILFVEDEPAIADPFGRALERQGFDVVTARSIAEARACLTRRPPDLVLLDLTLPDGDGRDLCRELRSTSRVPVIMLTARGTELDRVTGLEIGADDYVVKPFRPRELLARIAAHLRKSRSEDERESDGRMIFRDLVIDANERRVYRNDIEIQLTHTEFDLLAFLASNAGKVLSREKILNSVWGYEYPIETRVIDVHVRNLRRKIEEDASHPLYILAVPGIGYRFTATKP